MNLNRIISRETLFSADLMLACLVLAKLLIHLFTMGAYGFHRDEFLYLAMGEHLDWGYLEVPPFMAFLAALTGKFFGDTLFAVRLFPVLSGAAMVLLTGLTARELGGNRFAQFLAALAVLASPAYLRVNMLFTPVTFDQFYWLLGAYIIIRIINTGDQQLWPAFGVLSGIALLNKYTMLLFGFAVLTGLLFTPARKMLVTRYPWQAGIIAFFIFLPNLVWQHLHGWPVFEHMQALSEHQLVHVQTAGFLIMQVVMNLFSTPVWILGLYFYFASERGKPYRAIGWIYITALAVLLLFSGKAYYLLPAYPMLFAGGAVAVEQFIRRRQLRWLKPALLSFIIAGSVVLIPYGVPVFSVQSLQKYARFMGENFALWEPLRWEDGKLYDLPQEFADMLGWENQAATVAGVYHRLSPEEQAQCLILASNYGEAGAIDYYRGGYSLPQVFSFSGSYYLWGPGSVELCPLIPESQSYAVPGAVLIAVGIPEQALKAYYEEIEHAATITHPHAREGKVPVNVCRKPRFAVEDIRPQFSRFRF